MSRISGPLNRMGVISLLEDQHKISHVITESLCHYMDDTRRNHEGQSGQIEQHQWNVCFFRNKENSPTV